MSTVRIGGGTGISNSLSEDETAIVSVFDHGGHTEKIRDDGRAESLRIVALGDLSHVITATIPDDSRFDIVRKMMGHRFKRRPGSILNGARIANFILLGFLEELGDLYAAIRATQQICGSTQEILPISTDDSDLCAQLSDGETIEGEGRIDTRPTTDKRVIRSVFLKPKATIFDLAYDKIVQADKIVFGPGDLYTSIIPNTLVDGFRDAIAYNQKYKKGKLIFVLNLMTKGNETPNFNASRYARILLDFIGQTRFHHIICNTGPIPGDARSAIARYRTAGAQPVRVNPSLKNLTRGNKGVITESLATITNDGMIRHSLGLSHIIKSL